MKDIKYTKKKFETYFVAMQELLLKKCTKTFHLEKRNKLLLETETKI